MANQYFGHRNSLTARTDEDIAMSHEKVGPFDTFFEVTVALSKKMLSEAEWLNKDKDYANSVYVQDDWTGKRINALIEGAAKILLMKENDFEDKDWATQFVDTESLRWKIVRIRRGE